MKKLLILLLLTIPFLAFPQRMPSEQFVLYKVWSSDSTALKNLGWGDHIFSDADTVILQGSDTDTVVFRTVNPRGFFTVWITADTANFTIDGEEHNHSVGDSDSLSLSYKPKLSSVSTTGNPAVSLEYLQNLDWTAERDYYESIAPPLGEYLEFYLQHTGESDTSAVIIKLLWQ